MASTRILFLVNGLGLGNSTRCHAVIQRLLDRGAEIQVVTSGNGLWYFQSVPGIGRPHEVESLYYGVKEGRISIVRTLTAVADFAAILRRNARKMAKILSEWRPDVVVSDSVYTFRSFKRAGIPFVALNNADVVHQSYRRFTDRPRSVRPQFWCVEEPDYLFHRVIPDLVISPSLDPLLREVGGNVVRVGPIVRQGFSPAPARSPASRVLVMLSGSRFGSPVIFDRTDWPFEIEVVGRPAPPNWHGGGRIRFHGKLLDNRALVEKADMVVVNGGFSAVSESFSMRKPLVVIPVPNHAEQWINARTIEHLGVGMSAQERELENAMASATQQLERFHEGYRRLGEIPDGAAQAAKLIMSVATSKNGPSA
jgi:UDP-N-acetylglucosamine:LPS N-acetylglucosamine transferase